LSPNPVRPRPFLTRYLTLFGGEAVSKACVLAAFAYLARVLSPGDYGNVELALSIAVFLVLGVESGTGAYGARLVAADPARIPQLVPQVVWLRGILSLPIFAVTIAAAVYYRASGLGILAILGVGILLTPFLTQWVFHGLRAMQWVAAGSALRNLTFVAVVLLLVRPGSGIWLVAVAEICGIAALVLFNAFVLRRWLRPQLEWRNGPAGARRLFGEVWSLGLSDFAWAGLWYSPAVILGWVLWAGSEQVAWIGASVRIVVSLHTFVWLYFFNLLPNLSKELSAGIDEWKFLATRSLRTSMWPALLIAVAATLAAPTVIPMVYGGVYRDAVLPFQILVWMIPIAWFSGHFRFSLIAAGQQRLEFAASAAGAVVVIVLSGLLGRYYGATGAAVALLMGGVVNTIAATRASDFAIGRLRTLQSVGPAVASAAFSLAVGIVAGMFVAPIGGAVVASLVFLTLAFLQEPEFAPAIRQRTMAMVRRVVRSTPDRPQR